MKIYNTTLKSFLLLYISETEVKIFRYFENTLFVNC